LATINDSSFGSIVIDNKKYRRDVFIYPDVKVEHRKDGIWIFGSHIIKKSEVARLIEYNPITIVIGTGTDDIAGLATEAEKLVKERKINLTVLPSHKAVNDFNELTAQGKKVAS
jgi:hypothetical protein